MTSYSNGGFFNHGYHDSETLEIDRRFSSKTQHTNPYARENLTWRSERTDTHYSGQTSRDDGVERSPWGGRQEEIWRGGESIPMGHISARPGNPSWQHDHSHSTFQIPPDSQFDQHIRLPSSMAGNMTMRWRGISVRRRGMFPGEDPNFQAFSDDAIRNEAENEEQNLVKDLVALSTLDRIRAIRDLPMSFEDKKNIRSQVLAFVHSGRESTCCADCTESVSLSFRRFGNSIRSARQALELWQGTMKEIGGQFGTSVLSYFMFLKWLLMFNIFSFLINFGFITIPLLVFDPTPNQNVSFRGLEILTGAGYFTHTVMFYGGYSNETSAGRVGYDMQLAYFLTIAIYMVLCGLVLIYSMANSFRKNYVLANAASNSAWQLLCSWNFRITNERAVRQRKNNLRVQLKESLSEKAQGDLLTSSEKLKHLGIHLGSWLLSTGLAVGCGAGIYFLCQYEQQHTTDAGNWSLLQEASTLLVPFVVSLINLVVPLFYSLFNKFEKYSSQRSQIYTLVIRNVFLKMSILAVLCYYWMNVVAIKFSCWESMVGQALYRLVIFDFLFLLLGSFFGEFLSNVIGTRLFPRHGMPEFDVARNVLELINAQTLIWIGIYFSPLLPVIQILKFLILFYLKKVSLTQNCQPPRRSGRAAQMQTIFIALLFFPSFVGALSIVAYTAWSLTPSEQCGPFRTLNNTFGAVSIWIDDLEGITGSQWVIWIYQHVIRSEIFYYFITLIIIVIIYIFWQVTQGRKQLISRLRQQIVNEGKDKSFLLDKLQNLQKSNKNPTQKNQKKHTDRRSGGPSSGSQSNATVQALLARQQLEEEGYRHNTGGVPVPSDISTSSALTQAMLARQRAENQERDLHWMPNKHSSSSSALAQAMQARRVAERDEYNSTTGFSENHVNVPSAFDLAMQARRVAERDEYNSITGFSENHVNVPSASELAMQARQRTEEYEAYDTDELPSSMSDVMMQVMQARQRAEERPQNQAPAGSSALIQAMLARQQAQNEYDDGY